MDVAELQVQPQVAVLVQPAALLVLVDAVEGLVAGDGFGEAVDFLLGSAVVVGLQLRQKMCIRDRGNRCRCERF